MLNSIIKDLKVNILDGKQMLIIIAMPVVLTVILSFALGGTFSPSGLSEPINVGVVKLYDSEIDKDELLAEIMDVSVMPIQAIEAYKAQMDSFNPGQVFFDDFMDSDDIKGIMNYEVMSQADADQAIDDGSVAAVIVIPQNFISATYANMFSGSAQAEFKIKADVSYSYSGEIVHQVIKAFTDSMSMSFANRQVFDEIGGKFLNQMELGFKSQEFFNNLQSNTSDVADEIKTESVQQYKLVDSFTYYTAAMLCMFMLFSAGIGGRSMLEEKENITFDRMKVLGVTYFQMMLSKMVVVFLICLLQSAVMITLSSLFFGVDWGNYLSVIIIAICGSFAIGGLGSFIGAISLRTGNFKLANAFEGALVQVLALLGGSYIPLSILPKFFTKASKFTVNGQALSAYIKTAQGMGVGNIGMELLTIMLFGALFFGAAWLLISAERKKSNA